MSESERKQLKIKTGSVNRLKKELGLYATEKENEQQRVQRLKDAGADPHDIKHAEEVLAEASMMVPDTRQRLEAAVKDLLRLSGDLQSTAKLSGSEEAKAAGDALRDAQQLLISSC